MNRHFSVTVTVSSMRSPLGPPMSNLGLHLEISQTAAKAILVDISFGKGNGVKLLFAIPHVT